MAQNKKKREFFKEIYEVIDRLEQAGIDDNDQINFVLLVRGACNKPWMYVGNESFESAVRGVFDRGPDDGSITRPDLKSIHLLFK